MYPSEKGKPVERPGRKAVGLRLTDQQGGEGFGTKRPAQDSRTAEDEISVRAVFVFGVALCRRTGIRLIGPQKVGRRKKDMRATTKTFCAALFVICMLISALDAWAQTSIALDFNSLPRV